MIALVQRVLHASCTVEGKKISDIRKGLLAYVGIDMEDAMQNAHKMAEKIVNVRLFEDEQGKMNRSLLDTGLEIMVIPNFTLSGYLESRRPSFSTAKPKQEAEPLYQELCAAIEKHMPCKRGLYAGDMTIDARVDGPVNLIIKIQENGK